MTKNDLTHNGLIHLIYLILETKFGGDHSTHLSPDPSKKNHAAKNNGIMLQKTMALNFISSHFATAFLQITFQMLSRS